MTYPTTTLGRLFKDGLISAFRIAEDGEAIQRITPEGVERIELPAMEEGSGIVWVCHEHCTRREGDERYFSPELDVRVIPPTNWVDVSGDPDA